MKHLYGILAILVLLSLGLLVSCGNTDSCKGGHQWDAGEVTQAPTCTEAGERTFTCTECGETKTESVAASGHSWDEGRIIASPDCKSVGSCLYTCTVCQTKRTEDIPTTELHKWDDGYLTEIPDESSDGKKTCTCSVCGHTEEMSVSYTDYTEAVAEQRELLGGYEIDAFGGSAVTENLGDQYDAPPVSPVAGQHPRVLFNEDDIPGIIAAMNDPVNSAAAKEYLSLLRAFTDGKLPAATQQSDGIHNFSSRVLAEIQALAMDYQLTGNAVNGYRAIYAMKNNLLTLDIVRIESDQCRQYGNTMYIAACVYDWCYDLLTDDDRLQLTSGVEHLICTGSNEKGAKMEIGFPPSGQAAISGHGSERQLLRDYLSYAIAVFDELPGWWSYIGGRYYQEYVPVRDVYYQAGMYPQGISNYVRGRFVSDLWSAWLISAMSGSIPFDSTDMSAVMRTVYAYELPGGYVFNSGDSGSATAKFRADYGTCTLISSYLFQDSGMRAQLENIGHSYSTFSYANSFATATENLICSSGGVKAAEDRHEDMPLIQYNGGWLGQIIARSSWTDEAAAVVLAKIGQRSTANHDHQDAGTFQIFYRSLLAGDSGCYATYGSDHHKYYHQATIAHNGLLIYNPALASTNKGYYSGGQRVLSETGTLSEWLSSEYQTGTVTGLAYAYRDAEETDPIYAYIAGDITAAYDNQTVSDVNRRMLTIYTGDKDVPMLFVVFDSITARDGSFKKTFLLHTVTEPEIDGNTVTVINGDGKLVLQNLAGGDSITKCGGEGQNFLVNGSQIATVNGSTDGFYGRVEISPTVGNANDVLLNVMYVTDADSTVSLPAEAITATGMHGARIGDYALLFVTSSDRSMMTMTAEITGEGNVLYYVSGVSAGTWSIQVNGETVTTATATEESGLLTFTAPAGELTLIPGSDVILEGHSMISYQTEGGQLQSGAPTVYEEGTETPLPVPTRDNDIFAGWYTSADLNEASKVTAIPATATGVYQIYARWLSVILDEDYSEMDGTPMSEVDTKFHDVTYSGKNKTGSSFYGESDGDDRYLVWYKGDIDSSIKYAKSLYSLLGSETAVTYTVTLSKNGDEPLMPVNMRLRSSLGNKDTFTLLTVNTDGTVTANGQTLLTLTGAFQTLTAVVDFASGYYGVFSEDGVLLTSAPLTISALASQNGVTTTMEWLPKMTSHVIEFYTSNKVAGGSIRISDITIIAGAQYAVPHS